MWIKIEVIPSDRDIIFLPSSLEEETGGKQSSVVKFGGKSLVSEIQYTDDLSKIGRAHV